MPNHLAAVSLHDVDQRSVYGFLRPDGEAVHAGIKVVEHIVRCVVVWRGIFCDCIQEVAGGAGWLGSCGGNGLDELIVDLGLLDDDGSWGSDDSSLNNGWLVAAEELLRNGLLDLLGLGGLKEGVDGGEAFGLLGLGLGIELLLLAHQLLHDVLALLAGGDASVRVVQKSVERVLLLEVGVIGLEDDIVVHAAGESGNECKEGESALKVLLVLSLGGS